MLSNDDETTLSSNNNATNPDVAFETVNFEVHRDILYNLVFKQHHSLVGALVELIQNAFDAQANRIDISFDERGFKVADNGKGFTSRDEIISWFATFGKSHDADHANKFGRFRMGRGQIMGKAKTSWSSNTFSMEVDVKRNGMTFDISEVNVTTPGCHIIGEWYDQNQFRTDSDYLSDERVHLSAELAIRCKYLFPVSIFINERLITVDENKVDWSFENDSFRFVEVDYSIDYYRKGGSIAIYNLGILCGYIDVPGLSGDVITKEHVSLNMTRSEIQQDCPVIHKIKQLLYKLRKFPAKKKYSSFEAKRILTDFCNGMLSYYQIKDLMLFTNIKQNTWYSFSSLGDRHFSFSYSNNETANDRISQAFRGILLDSACLPHLDDPIQKVWKQCSGFSFTDDDLWSSQERTRMEITFFTDFIMSLAFDDDFRPQTKHPDIEKIAERIVSFCKLVPLSDFTNHILDNEKLSLKENIRLKAITKAYKLLAGLYDISVPLKIGESVRLEGWTDCVNFIAIERRLLNSIDKGLNSVVYLIKVLIHEISHYRNSDGDNHDANFYKIFHDISMTMITDDCASVVLKEYDSLLSKNKIVPSSGVVRAMRLLRRSGKSFALKNTNVYEPKGDNFYGFDRDYPLEFLPFTFDFSGTKCRRADVDCISLTAEDSELVFRMVSFEGWSHTRIADDLEYNTKDDGGNRLVTLSKPLVTFYSEICLGRYGKQGQRFYDFLALLKQTTFNWKQLGVDSIVLVGRYKAYEDPSS